MELSHCDQIMLRLKLVERLLDGENPDPQKAWEELHRAMVLYAEKLREGGA